MTEAVDKLRDIAFIGHGGAGKTSLAEAILYDAGVINRLGKIEDGNTALDFEPEELKRHSSISSGFHQFNWNNHTVNIIDTPGDQNFFTDTKFCLQAADAALVVVDAVNGIKVQTEQAWDFADDLSLPRAIFINKLDRERADFNRAFSDVTDCFKPKPIKLQLPIGSESDFKGVIDLISMKAYLYDSDGKATAADIPENMKALAEKEREDLIENVAEADDELIEKYLEGETLSDTEIKTALKTGTIARIFVPVLCGSATRNIGINFLMDLITNCMPSPLERGSKIGTDADGNEIERQPDSGAPFSAFIFKTVTDPYAGRLSIFRIVSGKLAGDGNFFNPHKSTKERFTQLLGIAGKEQKPITAAGPGDIVAVAKLKKTTTGDTLCDDTAQISFSFPDPLPSVITFAVGAKTKGD